MTKPRKALIGILIAGTLVATAVAVWADNARNGRNGGRLNTQEFAWSENPATTASLDWSDIPGLRVTTSCPSNFKSSAAVSLELAEGSAPVEVRVEQDDITVECVDCVGPEGLLNPEAVTFSAAPGGSSYTFVGKSIGEHGTRFDAQWRLTPGAAAGATGMLESGTLHVLWSDTRGLCF